VPAFLSEPAPLSTDITSAEKALGDLISLERLATLRNQIEKFCLPAGAHEALKAVAITRIMRTHKWFPVIAEVVEICDDLMRNRRRLLWELDHHECLHEVLKARARQELKALARRNLEARLLVPRARAPWERRAAFRPGFAAEARRQSRLERLSKFLENVADEMRLRGRADQVGGLFVAFMEEPVTAAATGHGHPISQVAEPTPGRRSGRSKALPRCPTSLARQRQVQRRSLRGDATDDAGDDLASIIARAKSRSISVSSSSPASTSSCRSRAAARRKYDLPSAAAVAAISSSDILSRWPLVIGGRKYGSCGDMLCVPSQGMVPGG
jgi:hypothetical protein